METTQIQARNPAMVRSAMKGLDGLMNGEQVGDGFAQIFAQLAEMMGTPVETEGTQEGETQDSDLLMMQMMAEMLLTNPAAAQLLPWLSQQQETQSGETSTQTQTDVSGIGTVLQQPQDAQNIQTVQTAQMAQSQADQAAQMIQKLPPEVQEFLQTVQAALQQPQNAQTNKTARLSVGAVTTEQSTETADIPVEGQIADDTDLQKIAGIEGKFYKAVQEIQQTMRKPGDSARKTETVDVDKLQSDVNANKFHPMTATKTTASQQSQAPTLTDQIRQSAADQLAKGKKEFVIKLKPEGLGEITVKLLERPGKSATLSLIASSTETARMINSELNALRNALRPLQVEVHEAVAQQQPTQEQNGGGNPQNNFSQSMFGQAFSGQHQSRESGHSGTQAQNMNFVPDDVVEEQLLPETDNSALDTYI